jgi:hypothetical protein
MTNIPIQFEKVTRAVMLGLLLVNNAVSQQTLNGPLFTDKAFGFKITLPKNWLQLPLNIAEQRCLARFQSKSRFLGDTAKGDPAQSKHHSLRILKVEKPWNGEGAKQRRSDYADYLGRVLLKGSYKPVKTPGTHNSLPIVTWDVRLNTEGYHRGRILTWVIPRGEHDYAVQFYVLEEHYPRLRPYLIRSLASFRFIKANPVGIPVTAKSKPFALRQWLQKPLLERRRQRAIIEDHHERLVHSRLPAGWTSQRSDYFLIVSHTKPKTTRYVRDTVEAFAKWLRERIGPLTDMHPMRTTIRICKNLTEYNSYRQGGWRVDYNFANREIVMCQDSGYLNMKDVLWGVYRRYMLDVAPEVYFNAPLWLHNGLYTLFSTARLKGGKITFPPSREQREIYQSLQDSKSVLHTAQSLMVYEKEELSDTMQAEAAALIRFFEGSGKRCKPIGKSFLSDYMKVIQQIARELDADDEEVLAWDSEEAIAAKLESKSNSKGRVYVPRLTDRWTRYLTTVRNRRKSFVFALYKRACPWSQAERATVERAFARARSRF